MRRPDDRATATNLSAVTSFLRSTFRRLPQVSRRDQRIRELEHELDSGDQLIRVRAVFR